MASISISLIALSIAIIFNGLSDIGRDKKIKEITSSIKNITDEMGTLNKRIKGITDEMGTLNKRINSLEKNNKISEYENQ